MKKRLKTTWRCIRAVDTCLPLISMLYPIFNLIERNLGIDLWIFGWAFAMILYCICGQYLRYGAWYLRRIEEEMKDDEDEAQV